MCLEVLEGTQEGKEAHTSISFFKQHVDLVIQVDMNFVPEV